MGERFTFAGPFPSYQVASEPLQMKVQGITKQVYAREPNPSLQTAAASLSASVAIIERSQNGFVGAADQPNA